MRIERTKLIGRIDELIEKARIDHTEKHRAAIEAHGEQLRQWTEETQPALLAELRKAVETVRKGRPLTKTNCKLFSRRYTSYLNEDLFVQVTTKAPEAKPFEPSSSLVALRNFLAGSPDEYISTTALKDLGFQPKALI